jgi:glyoxylase-like metal-dependent hydrolase (beta-lactamase superfamily II)
MPPAATEIHHISPQLSIWHAYDRTAKVELFSTAVLTDNGVTLIDPIALSDPAEQELDELGRIASIILTNVNHVRAAISFRERYATPIFASAELRKEVEDAHALRDAAAAHKLRIIPINGAAPGELALHDPRDSGTVIIGDALINFDPYGFTLLPRKYCLNQKIMIRCLHHLLDFEFRRLLFAHGAPITMRAREKLQSLLKEAE